MSSIEEEKKLAEVKGDVEETKPAEPEVPVSGTIATEDGKVDGELDEEYADEEEGDFDEEEGDFDEEGELGMFEEDGEFDDMEEEGDEVEGEEAEDLDEPGAKRPKTEE